MPDDTKTPVIPGPTVPPAGVTHAGTPDPVLHDGLTNGESAQAVEALFDPMVKRLTTLLTSFVTMTNSGDMAYWAVIAALGHTIKDLQWTNAPPIVARQFADLGRVLLRRYSEHLAAYRDEIQTWELLDPSPARPPFPQLRAWTNADVQAVHDEVDAIYLPKTEATNG